MGFVGLLMFVVLACVPRVKGPVLPVVPARLNIPFKRGFFAL
jgi:hypothetical protein